MITELNGQSIHIFWNVIAAALAIITILVTRTLNTQYTTIKNIIYGLSIGILIVDITYIINGTWIITHWILNTLGTIGGIVTVLIAAKIKEKNYQIQKYYLITWGIIAILIDGYYILAII